MIRSAITVSLVAEARGGPFVFWDDLSAAFKRTAELGFGVRTKPMSGIWNGTSRARLLGKLAYLSAMDAESSS